MGTVQNYLVLALALIQLQRNRRVLGDKGNLLLEIAPVSPMLTKQVRGASILKNFVALVAMKPQPDPLFHKAGLRVIR